MCIRDSFSTPLKNAISEACILLSCFFVSVHNSHPWDSTGTAINCVKLQFCILTYTVSKNTVDCLTDRLELP